MYYGNKITQNLGIVSKEILLVRKYASKWFLNILNMLTDYDDDFFRCAAYLLGNIKHLSKIIIDCLKEYNKVASKHRKLPVSAIKNLETCSPKLIPDHLDSIMEDYPYIHKTVLDTVKQSLSANLTLDVKLTGKNGLFDPLKRLFALDNKSLEMCLFIFTNQNYDEIESYFKQSLCVYQYDNYPLLASILEIDESQCKEIRDNLLSMGVTVASSGGPVLSREIDRSIKGIGFKSLKSRLCSPLAKCDIPINEFNIEDEEINHILRLLKIKHSEPTNILIYGSPGLGKSTFVRALAATLNIKAFEVLCNYSDSTADRRAAQTAAINMSNRYPGSFVLVDEAETLLHTDSLDFEHGTKKSWLTNLLETRGNRVIWIANTVEHLDPAIKRRFAYSVKFPELSKRDQLKIWIKTAKRLHVEEKLPQTDIKRLVDSYSVPVSSIEGSIRLAKAVATKNDFVSHIKRSLEAYKILLNDGEETGKKQVELDDCVLDGINTSMPIQDFLHKMEQINKCLITKERARAGMGSILFWGCSGAGKSFLSKYVAKMLERPCIIKRASDLLSKYIRESEGNIRDAFIEAKDEKAVLVIDECDSLILSRETAVRSWEISQVNEFLTSLEEYKGICICTTNFRKILDSAVMRRMSLKIEFKYALPHQLVALYRQILLPLINTEPTERELDTLQSHKHLCVGDFNTVKNQFWIEDKDSITHKALLDALAREERLKLESETKKVGFAV